MSFIIFKLFKKGFNAMEYMYFQIRFLDLNNFNYKFLLIVKAFH